MDDKNTFDALLIANGWTVGCGGERGCEFLCQSRVPDILRRPLHFKFKKRSRNKSALNPCAERFSAETLQDNDQLAVTPSLQQLHLDVARGIRQMTWLILQGIAQQHQGQLSSRLPNNSQGRELDGVLQYVQDEPDAE
jgi:hypothetical protein